MPIYQDILFSYILITYKVFIAVPEKFPFDLVSPFKCFGSTPLLYLVL